MRRRHNSDTTHRHRRESNVTDMDDIQSRIDLLHKLTDKIDKERKKNRVIIAMIGMLVLVAEVANIITKLVLRK